MSMFNTAMFLELLETLGRSIHEKMKRQGFWNEDKNNIPEKLALAHSELSEALEAFRKPHPDFKINETQWWSEDGGVSHNYDKSYNHPEGFGIEMADAAIRIMDICAFLKIDLGQAILDKMTYNDTRPYKHGKTC